MKKHSVDMTEGSILKHIITFAIPIILSGLLQMFYNAADMAVVGRFSGPNALAAVGSTSSAINLLVNAFIGLSSASGVVLARRFGAKDYEGVSKAVHTSVLLSIVGGVVLSIVGIAVAKPLLTAMDSPKEVLPLSTLYLRIYFMGLPANLFYNFASSVLRAIGDTKRPMYILMISGAINVVLNLFLVIGFGMSVDGVAIATTASQVFSAVMVLILLLKTDECYKLVWKKLRMDGKALKEILYLGIPAGFQSAAFNIANIMIQSSINAVGASAMAANAAASSVDNFTYISMNAFHHSALTFLSQNYGAKKFKRMTKGLWTSLITVTVVGVVLGGLTCIFAKQLLGIFTDDSLVVSLANQRMYIISAFYFLCGLQEVGTAGARSLGLSVSPMVMTLITVCGLRMIVVWLGGPYEVWSDLFVLFWAYLYSWLLNCIVNVTTFFIVKRAREKNFQ